MKAKQKEHPTMEATSLLKVSSTITVLQNKSEIEAALNNQLEVAGKRVLVCKGGNEMGKIVEHVYRSFADHRDTSGEPFLLSKTLKGLCHRDNWGSITKISEHDYIGYLSHWNIFAEYRTSLDGTQLRVTEAEPALVLLPKCPRFSVQIWSQSRWLTPTIAGWFKWLED
jgi:hypothetical protein